MLRKTLITASCIGAIGALWLWVLVHAAPKSDSRSTVVEAAMRGDRDTVRSLLKEGDDVNSAQPDGMTALHWAVQKNDVELAKLLLYGGANVRATTRIGGYTPLLIASKNGQTAMIETLLTAGADAKSATANGATALMLASQAGNADAVKMLITHGADVNAVEQVKGESALYFAAAYGRADVVRVLTASGANPNVATKVINLDAFNKEEQERFAQFAQQAGQAAGRGAQAGAAAGAAPAAQARGGRGYNPNAKPGIDRQYNYTELVGYWGGLAPLHIAARQGELGAVKALLDAHADVNQRSAGDKVTPILVATINGNFDIAKYMLDHGADEKLAQENGVTPLYAALNCQWADKALYPQPRAQEQQQLSYLDMMQALLEKGADPNARLRRKVWYCAVRLRSVGHRRSGRDRVLARRLRRRHRRDEAAGEVRRRREPRDDADPRTPTTRRRPSARRAGHFGHASDSGRRPRSAAAARGGR